MKFIVDGNFSGWLRAALVFGGIAIFGGSLAVDALPRRLALAGILLGWVMAALGGVSSRAHMLHLKPFDNSYKKARKSYETKDDDESKL